MSEDHLLPPAARLGREIAAGRVDPVALCESCLDAVAGHPAGAAIYARTMPARARAQAEAAAARAREGAPRGPLDGVPISWKDSFDVAGVGCEAGSHLLAGRVPAITSALVSAADAAGLVGLGKTHMSELAFSGLGYNPKTATPPSRYFPGAVPGGSSSGAAASVAQGLAAAAVGSDTGGSVRVPAAWNGLVGLKPAAGRLSQVGMVPLCPSFDIAGPIARTVEDAALLFAALAGERAPDLRGAELAGVRLAVLENVAFEGIDDLPAIGFDRARAALERAGARVEPISVADVSGAMELAGTLFTAEAWGYWGPDITANRAAMFDRVRERFESGASVRGGEFVDAWRRLRALRAGYGTATGGHDAVILPTTANRPPPLRRVANDADFYVTENLRTLRNTRIANLLDLAALTIPTGEPAAGLMLMGPPGSEVRLLRLGAAAQAAIG